LDSDASPLRLDLSENLLHLLHNLVQIFGKAAQNR